MLLRIIAYRLGCIRKNACLRPGYDTHGLLLSIRDLVSCVALDPEGGVMDKSLTE